MIGAAANLLSSITCAWLLVLGGPPQPSCNQTWHHRSRRDGTAAHRALS